MIWVLAEHDAGVPRLRSVCSLWVALVPHCLWHCSCCPRCPPGRAPALFDSLVQSLLMAPMFICIEVAFRFGLLPEFHKRVEVLVAQRRKDFGTD